MTIPLFPANPGSIWPPFTPQNGWWTAVWDRGVHRGRKVPDLRVKSENTALKKT
jgi:hypothetical protein